MLSSMEKALSSQFTLKGYAAVFSDDSILMGYWNSIKYTVVGTFFSVVMIYITAYPLSNPDLPGRKFFNIFFVITMYFGGGLIPTYLIVKDTGLINTIWAMFLPGGVAVSNMIIARNFFETSIPKELKEAAEIDGASNLRIFWDIIIPLSKPIMAVMVVFSMVAYWNDWFTALIYMTGEGRAPPAPGAAQHPDRQRDLRQPSQHDLGRVRRAEQAHRDDQVRLHHRGGRPHAHRLSLCAEIL